MKLKRKTFAAVFFSLLLMGGALLLMRGTGQENIDFPASSASALILASQQIPKKVVVLTFDDASRSHFTVARPILKERGFSATFFIAESPGFENKEHFMTWQQIRQLHMDGFEIGNHTLKHFQLHSFGEKTAKRLPEFSEQIEALNEKCVEYGISKPVSFAYPGNKHDPVAFRILDTAGIKFARRGGEPEYVYTHGEGPAFLPGEDHPLLIPSAGDARPEWSLDDFKAALGRASQGGIPVLQFHGVPDHAHGHVSTPADLFRAYMNHLRDEGYRVLALRDLELYVDPSNRPEDPGRIIRERMR